MLDIILIKLGTRYIHARKITPLHSNHCGTVRPPNKVVVGAQIGSELSQSRLFPSLILYAFIGFRRYPSANEVWYMIRLTSRPKRHYRADGQSAQRLPSYPSLHLVSCRPLRCPRVCARSGRQRVVFSCRDRSFRAVDRVLCIRRRVTGSWDWTVAVGVLLQPSRSWCRQQVDFADADQCGPKRQCKGGAFHRKVVAR